MTHQLIYIYDKKMQPPIDTVDLFPILDDHLIALLRALSPEDWGRLTIAKRWTVKDVAAHLLHGNIRTLSTSRDRYFGKPVMFSSYDEIVNYVNADNADWIAAWQQVSPPVLMDLLALTGGQFCEHLRALDAFAPSRISVAWAGETTSLNWFHVAREYTEKWHHQQQIRDAVNLQGILTKQLYKPCLDTFMMALPHTYRNVAAPVNTVLRFTVTGEGGGDWWLVKQNVWELVKSTNSEPVAHTTIEGAVAWKLFTKSWRRQDVADHVHITGDRHLGGVILDMVAVMA